MCLQEEWDKTTEKLQSLPFLLLEFILFILLKGAAGLEK